MKTSSHKDVYQMASELIIKKLIPRKQPWDDYGSAVNYNIPFFSKMKIRGFEDRSQESRRLVDHQYANRSITI